MSDEIPVGSPPAPPGRHAAPGGWYPDPAKAGQERYWDGWQWTRNVREAERPVHHQAPPGRPWIGQPQQAGQPPAWGTPGRPVAATADGVPLAGWWMRVLAHLIDYIAISFVVEVISMVTGLSGIVSKTSNELQAYLIQVLDTGEDPNLDYLMQIMNSPAMWLLIGLTVAVGVLYEGFLLRFKSASLGKLATGLRVVPVGRGQSTERLSWSMAFGRATAANVLRQINLLGLLDALFPLWDPRRQSLHDKIAKTQVIRIR